MNKTSIEIDQDELCKMCEADILECSSNSIHFQCEGGWCEEATELYIENKVEELYEAREEKLESLLDK